MLLLLIALPSLTVLRRRLCPVVASAVPRSADNVRSEAPCVTCSFSCEHPLVRSDQQTYGLIGFRVLQFLTHAADVLHRIKGNVQSLRLPSTWRQIYLR